MKVLLLSAMDSMGGAGRAACRLHQAFLANSVQSDLWVGSKSTDFETINNINYSGYHKSIHALKIGLAKRLMKLQKSTNSNLHSLAFIPSGIVEKINNSDANLVQLNWICNEFISVEDIGKITKPIVWRLSDMWAFCGAEHIGDDGLRARWRSGYQKDNRVPGDSGIDFDRWVWRRKVAAWRKPMHIVAPSHWMAQCVRDSALMSGWPVSVIPATVDMQRFKPWDKRSSREILGLPLDKHLILFGAAEGIRDRNKGADLLQESLLKGVSKGLFRSAVGVIFGQSKPQRPPVFGLPIHWLGVVRDEITLSLIYSAADILIVPSRQDNLPQVALEAQACGCPVVGFHSSGMPDVVQHQETGYLAKAFDTEELAHGIDWVLSNKTRYQSLSVRARERALSLWSQEQVVKQYLALYQNVLTGTDLGSHS